MVVILLQAVMQRSVEMPSRGTNAKLIYPVFLDQDKYIFLIKNNVKEDCATHCDHDPSVTLIVSLSTDWREETLQVNT